MLATVFVPEFPVQCTGSFCMGRNIHRGPGKLCPPCRAAKLRHNKTERSKPANVWRANPNVQSDVVAVKVAVGTLIRSRVVDLEQS
jgi:hypothetical protein